MSSVVVSHPLSGFSLAMPEAAVARLGGKGASVAVQVFGDPSDGWIVQVSPSASDPSRRKVSDNSNSSLCPYRVSWGENLLDLPRFGALSAEWRTMPGGIEFDIPAEGLLPKPVTRAKHTRGKTAKPQPVPYRERLAAWLAEGRSLLPELPESHTLTASAESGGASVELGRSSVLRVQIVEEL